jgi:hypothetical protein
MRTPLFICGPVLGLLALSAPLVHATSVTRVATSGTTANLNLVVSTPGSRSNCTVDLWVSLTAATSVQRSNNTTSTGAIGFVQRVDTCTDEFEFGSFNVSLPSTAFTSGSGTADLTATIPVTLDSFGPAGGTVNRTLIATLHFQNVENNSVASRSFGRISAPSFLLVTRSRSIFNAASVTGQLTLDGQNLVTAPAALDGSIETGSSATIDITR